MFITSWHSFSQRVEVAAFSKPTASAISHWVDSSATDARAMKRKRTVSRLEPRSLPSAILLGMLMADRLI